MGVIGGELGYRTLRFIAPGARAPMRDVALTGEVYKVERFLGDGVLELIKGKTVVDFGCGMGYQAVQVAESGAGRVIGLDILDHHLEHARQHAEESGVSDRCVFAKHTEEKAEVIICLNSFEHFADPAGILRTMSRLLKPDGIVLVSFGPPWLHPFGGHLFSVFPWSHLLFTERSQIRWRSDFKDDGATCFSEVAGGLNQITIGRFERLVADSPLKIDWLKTIPIRGIGLFRNRLIRELGSSVIRCDLTLDPARAVAR